MTWPPRNLDDGFSGHGVELEGDGVPPTAARSDEDVFDQLYRAAWPHAVRAAMRIVRDPGVAEDIAQEAFPRAFDRWRTVGTHPYPEAWVLRVTINLALDTVRRKIPQFVAPAPIDIDEMVVNAMLLRNALARLSRNQRAALVLRYFAGYQNLEMADALHTRPGTVKTHLTRGTRRLHQLLGGDDGIAGPVPP